MVSSKDFVRLKGFFFLFSISFLSLFLELLLIRWIAVEIRAFAFFRNLTLISCFLGLGIGFSFKRFRVGLLLSLLLIALLVAAVHPGAEFSGISLRMIPEYLTFSEFYIWYAPESTTVLKMAAGFAMIAVVVVILAWIFIPFGRILGEIFEASDNRVRDYSINLAGSLCGTWAFALISYLNTPPWMWFLFGTGGMVPLIRPRSWKMIAALLALIPITFLTIEKDTPDSKTFWSPYQKIRLKRSEKSYSPEAKVPFYSLEINSVLYMFILDLSEDQFEMFPEVFQKENAPYYPYDMPFRFHASPDKVLIMGAGAGNDAAAALRNGASHVDAVEIDPIIARLGELYHPERSYQDSRVRLIIDDARSFFKKTHRLYDLIIFALLDSHTLTSNFTNINLDSYVYTKESLKEAKAHLAEGGVMALSFQVNNWWLGSKLYYLVKEVFREPPLIIFNYTDEVIRGTGGTLFLCGDMKSIHSRIKEDAQLAKVVSPRTMPVEDFERIKQGVDFDVPTDDWPYIYLKKRQIPVLYIIMIFMMIALMLLAIRFLFPGGRLGPSHFLFLGAGFMLVEVHSISKTALLFGSTWIVNVVIISAILVMILGANLVVLTFKVERLKWWYAGLLLWLILNYLVPVHELMIGKYLLRGLLAGAFYSLPLFFAGVIFASSIRRVLGIEAAFASNMLGACIGGMLESTSFVFGLKSVVLVAVFLYAASALALRSMPVMDSAS
jgi:hypothetical protein